MSDLAAPDSRKRRGWLFWVQVMSVPWFLLTFTGMFVRESRS